MLNFLNTLNFERSASMRRSVEPYSKPSKQSYRRYGMLNFLNTFTIERSSTLLSGFTPIFR